MLLAAILPHAFVSLFAEHVEIGAVRYRDVFHYNGDRLLPDLERAALDVVVHEEVGVASAHDFRDYEIAARVAHAVGADGIDSSLSIVEILYRYNTVDDVEAVFVLIAGSQQIVEADVPVLECQLVILSVVNDRILSARFVILETFCTRKVPDQFLLGDRKREFSRTSIAHIVIVEHERLDVLVILEYSKIVARVVHYGNTFRTLLLDPLARLIIINCGISNNVEIERTVVSHAYVRNRRDKAHISAGIFDRIILIEFAVIVWSDAERHGSLGYLDRDLLGRSLIVRIAARSDQTVVFSYIFNGLQIIFAFSFLSERHLYIESLIELFVPEHNTFFGKFLRAHTVTVVDHAVRIFADIRQRSGSYLKRTRQCTA